MGYSSLSNSEPDPGPSSQPQAVLVRRRPDPDRRLPARVVLNHDEVLAAVEAAGWSVTVHDSAKLPDASGQCAMFNMAQLIVAPHGAGLTNMLCCRPGTTVIEIKQSDSGYNKSFLHLAASLGLNYIALETKPPFSLPFYGSGRVNASAVGEAAADVLRTLDSIRGKG